MFLCAPSWIDMVPTQVSSEADTDHAAANTNLLRHPKRIWRATTETAHLRYDITGLGPLGAVFIDRTNANELEVMQSTSVNGAYSQLVTQLFTTTANGQDSRVGNRRKAWIPVTTTQNFVQIRGIATPGDVALEIGTVALIPAASIITMLQNPGRPAFRPRVPEDVLVLPGGSVDVNTLGTSYLDEYVFGNQLWSIQKGVLPQLHQLYHSSTGVVLLYENLGTPAHAYCLKPLSIDLMEVDPFSSSGGITFREWG